MDFVQHIGLSENTEKKHGDLTLYFIKNPDKSIRWLWNSNNSKADFLKFYAVSSLKSKLFAGLIKMIFIFKLQHVLFKKQSIYVTLDSKHILSNYVNEDFALFTGTKGPNRKLVLYSRKGNSTKFIKIACSDTSKELINKEYNELEFIKTIKSNYFITPKVKHIQDGIIELEDLSDNGYSSGKLEDHHIFSLSDIFNQTLESTLLLDLECFKNALKDLQKVKLLNNPKIPNGLLYKLEKCLETCDNTLIHTSFAHKDFTPWNTKYSTNLISIFDWEMAEGNTPAAFDIFHFIIQNGILVERKNWKQIKTDLKNGFDKFSKKSETISPENFDLYLKLYLIINTSYYLKIYSEQKEWHIQINWLLNTWNDALSDILQNDFDPRKLLILDSFDFLQNLDYATIKFPEVPPTELDKFSDIDICINFNDSKKLLNHLTSSPIIKTYQLRDFSYMSSVIFLLKNGDTLALDLIWQFKRKDIQYLNAADVLESAYINKYKIKCMSDEDTKDYLSYFYLLNNSPIPEKYIHYFKEQKLTKESILPKLNAKIQNKGISKIKNQLFYCLDTLKNMFREKGIVITFSGVDGAGKSTIIEHTKKELEKRFRKKVIVIRHRPSILPIISAITYGKAGAEKRSADNLPRQGKNKSIFSSLLRFGYYYFDYLFGQFVIYFKYTSRGYVVLYDRYYFDFINDSVRSNIKLPKRFVLFCYRFLMSPDINFFLYADPEIILKRKQELDKNTIISLTKDYIDLFSKLSEKEKNISYLPIENIVLEETMALISESISKKLF